LAAPYGVWRCQYLRERRAAASSQNSIVFAKGATLFDLVSDDDMRGALPLVGGLQRAT